MTDEEVVRGFYPNAVCERWSDNPRITGWVVSTDDSEDARVLGHGDTPELAWANARQKLEAA